MERMMNAWKLGCVNGRVFVIAITILVWAGSDYLLSRRDSKGIEKTRRDKASDWSQSISPNGMMYVGSASCAAASCHGHKDGLHPAGREHEIWIEQDPHARAYSALFNERSRDIASKLGMEKPPHLEPTCTACHATTSSQSIENSLAGAKLADGVGCESCHGPAKIWLNKHTRSDWPNLSSDEKAAVGFVDGNNLLARVQSCTECHVGAPGRDVNHDLIAAGHPRLYFEMSAQLARLPRHWSREKDLLENGRELEAKLWAVGQVASAAAAAGLLAERAGNSSSPWPEFAEQNCFACHQPIRPPGLNRLSEPAEKPINTLQWATWHTSQLETLCVNANNVVQPELQSVLKQLNSELARPRADRHKVAELAKLLKQILDRRAVRLADTDMSESTVKQYLKRLTDSNRDPGAAQWDTAVQRFLGVVALRQAVFDQEPQSPETSPGNGYATWRGKLESIREQLIFPEGLAGPRNFDERAMKIIEDAFAEIENILNQN